TISNIARDAELDLRAGIDPAPDLQPSAHIFSPLAHAGQAEVPGGLPPDGLLVQALPIIADPQAELPLVVLQFHCDPPRPRVPEGVAQCLARDAVRLVAHDGVQIAR